MYTKVNYGDPLTISKSEKSKQISKDAFQQFRKKTYICMTLPGNILH